MLELLASLFFLHLCFCQNIDQKICSSLANKDACSLLARNLTFACNEYTHKVDCMLDIENNKSHFGRITGEEALLGARMLNKDVVVVGEILSRHSPSEMVVIVKADISNSIENLRGKKFCHPGFKHNNLIPNLLLEELENSIIPLNNSLCDNNNLTLVERKIRSLKYFFGDSCRPGPWVQNPALDSFLKEEYSSLCNLCGYQKCGIDYKAPFNDSLKCLLNNNADVAVTTLLEANLFFSSYSNQQSYKYLCKNGTSIFSSPCVWSKLLPDVLIGQRNVVNNIISYLRQNIPSKINETILQTTTSEFVESALTQILDLKKHETIFFSKEKTLLEYVEERRSIPTIENSKLCNTSMKWCTLNEAELQKCKWLSQAALIWGIQPVVECVKSPYESELSCLDDIKKNVADIAVVSSDYAYAALKKELTNIAYPETDTRYLPVILAVKRSNDTSINKFEDLKGKKTCIPRFGGKEHLVFVDTIRNLKIIDNTNCDYGKVLSDFVSDSCAPGVRSNFMKESTNQVNKDTLCSLCKSKQTTSTATYCNDDDVNHYYGNNGSVSCISDSVADFAVITKFDLPDDNFTITVICRNNTLASYAGLNVDNDCALNVVASSQVVARIDSQKIPDMISALYEYEKWFGQNLEKSFYLFDAFNNTKNLLFKDSTPGLTFDDELQYITNYKNLLNNVNQCSYCGKIKPSFFIFIVLVGMKYIFP